MANISLSKGVNNTYPLSQTFQFDNLPVRTVDRDGEIWFVAADVCAVLEINNPRQAITKLDEDEKNTVTINDGIQGNPNFNIISESGLYALVLTSRKASARRFKRWVTHEVLPAIRKSGSYSVPALATNNQQHLMIAHSLASSTAAAVAKAVFAALLADPDQDIHHCRFALSLTAGHAGNADRVHLQKIPDGSIVTSLEQLATRILEPNGMRPTPKVLTDLATACLQRLTMQIK